LNASFFEALQFGIIQDKHFTSFDFQSSDTMLLSKRTFRNG